jgi:mono/diheme cytochrome c family protein
MRRPGAIDGPSPLLLCLPVWLFTLGACRGDRSSEPPVHLNLSLDQQARFDPQERNDFFWDHRAMRRPPAGTVAVGQLHTDRALAEGLTDEGFARDLPAGLRLDRALLARGRERFGIYCAPCHDTRGRGDGVVYRQKGGLARPTSLNDPRLRAMRLGEIVHTITHGMGAMQAMASLVPERDRWAIAVHVRALQPWQGEKQ